MPTEKVTSTGAASYDWVSEAVGFLSNKNISSYTKHGSNHPQCYISIGY